MLLASRMVQVTTEAKARDSITAFTTTSAERNMLQTERLCGRACPGVAVIAPVSMPPACCPQTGIESSATAKMQNRRTADGCRVILPPCRNAQIPKYPRRNAPELARLRALWRLAL